jgi:PAS domain S-box-containing protein
MSKSGDQKDLLRTKAEAQLAKSPVKSGRVVNDLLHELQVHQIELEMQNDELRRTRLEMEEARDRYVDLYEFAPVGYVTLSQQAHISAINLTGAAMLGEDRKQLLHRNFARIVAPEDQANWQDYIRQAFSQHDSHSGELALMRKDRTRLNVRLDSRLVATASEAPMLRVTLVDNSEQKQLELMLRDNNLELASARYMADKANQAKSEFLSGMSHELRSPLNAILGFAQLLESSSPQPTPSQQMRIHQILEAGWYLLELINEILDLAQIESGKLLLSNEPVSVSQVLLDCYDLMESQAEKNAIRISFPSDCTFFVNADRTRLKQVLVNLLSNAIKYNRVQGSVEVTCHTNTTNHLHVSVSDTGVGLSAEKISHLFQPFNRLGQESGPVQGTGIGLIVSKRLIELMGGKIGVESTVGKGSEFWIELPLATALRPSSTDQQHPAPSPGKPAARKSVKKFVENNFVLCVEDNKNNMLLVEQLLARRSDLQLLKAENGAEGIAMALAHKPRVILMDINLPGISGIQVLKLLRLEEATAHIPVLAISANAMTRDIENGLAAGFFRYITKPIQIDVFMDALDDALKAAETTTNIATKKGNTR